MKNLLFLVLISSNIYANNILNHIDYAAKRADIEPKLLRAISKTESNFNKFAIGIVLYKNKLEIFKNTFLEKNKVKYMDSKRFVSLNIKSKKEAYFTLKNLQEYMYSNKNIVKTYDLGLMQININNIKNKEKEFKYYLNTKLNTLFGALVLKQCYNYFNKNVKYAIECYNKGTNKNKFKKFSYYKKVKSNFLKM